MKLRIAWLLVAMLGIAAEAFGQQRTEVVSPQSVAVQLPTYSYFGVGTTVVVPDRGSTYLGGVNRAAAGSSEFGVPLTPFRNRAIGGSLGASSTRMSVYVHDFEAMDEYLLSQPTAFNGLQPRTPEGRQPWSGAVQAETPGLPAVSLETLRAQHEREEQTRHREAVELVERARSAEAAGKKNVAKIYYQMASSRASGSLKTEIAARLGALQNSPTKLAQDR